MVNITKEAAQKINEIQQAEAEDKRLRLFVEEGGCHGMRYGIGFDCKRESDFEFESQGIQLLVDAESIEYLKNITLDLHDDEEKEFKILNPNATSSCGCGDSFSA